MSNKHQDFLKDLESRGLVYDCSNKEKLISALKNNKKIYLGIDPTGTSLHIGHYLSLSLLKRFIENDYRVVILIGGFTAMIGDPSFKNQERPHLSRQNCDGNVKNIVAQIQRIVNSKVEILNNRSFYDDLSLSDFLRTCESLTANSIISKEFIQQRLATGLTVKEFLYPIFQAYDFNHLYKHHDVSIQLGGSDQWGNIMIGIDLIKKENTCQEDPLAVGLTFPLLLDHKNQKFGKSENNAYFLDPSLTSPYALYQYLINLADDLTCQLLRYLSSSQLSEVDTLIQQHVDKPCMKLVQKALVRELLPSIHPNESVDELEITSYKLFNASDELTKKDFASIKSTIPTIEIKEPSSIGSILKQLGFVSSSSEAARLIKEKCVYCFGKNILNANQNLIEEDMRFKYSLIKKGKKEYGLVFHAY